MNTQPSTEITRIAMTLSAIAYAEADQIPALLANPMLSTRADWDLHWQGQDIGNQALVARHRKTGQLAVAIRGSIVDPSLPAFWVDWLHENLSLGQLLWPWGNPPEDALVAQGSLHGLQALLDMTDAQGDHITQALMAAGLAESTLPVLVTGHSLGAALAEVLALRLCQLHPNNTWLPLTFAAPPVGTPGLGSWMRLMLGDSSGRFFNTLDAVPRAWCDMQWILTSYAPPGPEIPVAASEVVAFVERVLKGMDLQYAHGMEGCPLEGSSVASEDSWFSEVGHQHAHDTYLKLVGAPLVPLESNAPKTQGS